MTIERDQHLKTRMPTQEEGNAFCNMREKKKEGAQKKRKILGKKVRPARKGIQTIPAIEGDRHKGREINM